MLYHKQLDVVCYLIENVGYITNYDMFLYVILLVHSTGYLCVLSQTTRCHCTLSHKTFVIIVCYYKIMGVIACYHINYRMSVTNYWTSFYVISQTVGCYCLLPHKLMNVFYLTKC
jgi:hypothetical protein